MKQMQQLVSLWTSLNPAARRMAAGVLVLAAGALVWRAVLSPLIGAVSVQRANLAELKGKIEVAQMLAGQLAGQQAVLSEARAEYQRVRRRIGDGHTVARVLEELGRLAKQEKLGIAGLEPQDNEAAPRLLAVEGGLTIREVPVRLKLKGRYQQMGQFLAALSGASSLATVQRINFTRPDAESAQLEAELVLAIYLQELGTATEPWAGLLANPASRYAQQERLAELGWTRDPFLRGGPTGAAGGFVLSGILWDATAPIAIINGEPLRAGDRIGGYQILSIEQDRVSLTDGEETLQLLIAP